jgi:hypothetical protein
MIESDSSEKLGRSVDEESQMVPERFVSLSRNDIKKIFAQSGISELEPESRYQGFSS